MHKREKERDLVAIGYAVYKRVAVAFPMELNTRNPLLLFLQQANVPSDEVQSLRSRPKIQVHSAAGHCGRRRLPIQIPQQVIALFVVIFLPLNFVIN